MTDETESRDCGRYKPHPAHRFMLGRKVQVCPGRAQSEPARPATAMLADAFEVPLHLIDTTQPVEHCGNQLPPLVGDRPVTECVLRPGHQGSHANDEGCRWIEKSLAGYCPHCGRGDCAPTADEYAASQRRAIRIQTLLDDTRDRARKDAIASRESERMLQQQIDAQAREIDRLRDEHQFEQKLSADLRARLKAASDAYSDADTALYELRKGEEELTDEHVQPTPAQWIWQWNQATPEQRRDMAGRILQVSEAAEACFLLDHKGEAPRRKHAEAAIERVRETAACWERMPGDRHIYIHEAARALRTALEPPKETP